MWVYGSHLIPFFNIDSNSCSVTVCCTVVPSKTETAAYTLSKLTAERQTTFFFVGQLSTKIDKASADGNLHFKYSCVAFNECCYTIQSFQDYQN
uniref:Uncharacterized protein n=1 Tax=Romanomermis culicivorax TaxID=13658 RepID=A0A915HRS5_ROMCU